MGSNKSVSLLRWGKVLYESRAVFPTFRALAHSMLLGSARSKRGVSHLQIKELFVLFGFMLAAGGNWYRRDRRTDRQNTEKGTAVEVHAEWGLGPQILGAGFRGLEIQQRPQLQMSLE